MNDEKAEVIEIDEFEIIINPPVNKGVRSATLFFCGFCVEDALIIGDDGYKEAAIKAFKTKMDRINRTNGKIPCDVEYDAFKEDWK